MLDMHEIRMEIDRLEHMPTCYDVCKRLACLYTILHHMHEDEEHSEERGEYTHLTEDDAHQWVEHMESDNPEHRKGGRWSMEEARALASKIGWSMDTQTAIEFYAVLNAMYSDYSMVLKKYGMSSPEFYADMAKAWLCDKDAKTGKAGLYFEHIVKR